MGRCSPVTVCAAAICTERTQESGQSAPQEEHVLVVIADGMLPAGDTEYEPDQTKIFTIHESAIALVAGDYDIHMSLVMETRRKLGGRTADISEVASLYSEAFAVLRRSRAETAVLTPLGLTLNSFTTRRRQLEPGLVQELRRALADSDLGVEAIIAGIDARGPHVWDIYDPGIPECHDGTAFFAIGAGARQFRTQFLPSGFTTNWGLLETLLLMYQSKKMAERCPGVGPATDLLTMGKDGVEIWESEQVTALDAYYKELEQAIEAKKQELYGRMVQDARIWPLPEAGESVAHPQPPAAPAP